MSVIQDAIDEIMDYIVANGSEDITADVLRPLLVGLGNAVQATTGDVDDLVTANEGTIVDAVNEARALAINAGGKKNFTGTADPNVTPPIGYKLGDYYARYSGSTLINYYQFNGYNWIEII